MNTTTAIRKLMLRYRPAEIETIRKSRRHPEGKVSKVRPATVIMRRPLDQDGNPGIATIAELMDAFIEAHDIKLDVREGESAVGRAFRLAETEGVVALKRDKDGNIITREGSDIPTGAWLAQDRPVRKRRTASEKVAQRENALRGELAANGLMDMDDDFDMDADDAADDAEA